MTHCWTKPNWSQTHLQLASCNDAFLPKLKKQRTRQERSSFETLVPSKNALWANYHLLRNFCALKGVHLQETFCSVPKSLKETAWFQNFMIPLCHTMGREKATHWPQDALPLSGGGGREHVSWGDTEWKGDLRGGWHITGGSNWPKLVWSLNHGLLQLHLRHLNEHLGKKYSDNFWNVDYRVWWQANHNFFQNCLVLVKRIQAETTPVTRRENWH